MTQVALDTPNASTVRITAGERAGIPPRRMDFEFTTDDSSKYWFDGNPYITLIISALSTTFPAGETFFVNSVKHFRSQIKDQKLKDEVTGFIGQEALHSKEHMAFDRLLDKYGLPGKELESLADKTIWLLEKMPKKLQLAATCGMEHYTAAFAEFVLRDEEIREGFKDETVKKLWIWHALEENEHKTVAFDVYQEVAGGGYFTRALGMAVATMALFGTLFIGHMRLLWADKKLFDFTGNAKGFWWAFGWGGIAFKNIGKILDYFRPGFHPLDHDTEQLLQDWKKELFKEGGMLADQIKNPSSTNMA